VFQADQLFATLDPTLRRLALPDAPAVVLADTVGFVNQLPHELVAAFRSTLQETRSADLLLHVVDAGSEQRARRIADVETVLDEIGAKEIPTLLVFNKIDTLTDTATDSTPRVDRDALGKVTRVWLSAQTGAGVDLLLAVLADHFRGESLRQRLRLGPADGALRAWLFSHARVLSEAPTKLGGWDIEVEISRAHRDRYMRDRDLWKDRLIAGDSPDVAEAADDVAEHADADNTVATVPPAERLSRPRQQRKRAP
jgi:GTP-binding protein HflX